jgi:sigma-B regulation protein RsbU (phosphoserine phosphatase)
MAANRRDPSSTEDLEDLYENAPCGYLSMQPDGRIVKVNATLAAWTGYPADQIVGKRLLDLLNVAGRIFYETHFAPLLRMQGFFNEIALDFITADGRRLPVLANALERRDAEGRVLFIRLTIFKATQRRRYERDLVDARAAAEATAKELQASLLDERTTAELREQFIAVLGHDLRSPLAAVISGMRLLEREPLSERGYHVLALVRSTISRMSGLIDNVMDFARGRLGGGITLTRTSTPMQTVLEQVVAEISAANPERVIESLFDLSINVDCDASRISQLFSNILSNAVKYGAADRPIVVHAVAGQKLFELSVANAGDPIPPEAMERLFAPFSRGEVRPSQQGLGLGLYIASQIAQAHGGQIDVASNREETRFTFRMPLPWRSE